MLRSSRMVRRLKLTGDAILYAWIWQQYRSEIQTSLKQKFEYNIRKVAFGLLS